MPNDELTPEPPVWDRSDWPTQAVTPAIAREWLKRNHCNRPIRRRIVDQYARDMASGNWLQTGDTMKFDRDGNLLDGQHRLTAIAEGDVTIELLVLTGLDPSTQLVMDSGAKRSAADQFKLLGRSNTTNRSSVCRLLLRWEDDDLVTREVVYSNQELIGFDDRNQDLMNEAIKVASRARANVHMGAVALAAVFYRAHLLDPGSADRFFDQVHSLSNLAPNSPILALVRTMQRRQRDRLRTDQVRELYYLVSAWNGVRKGRAMSRMQLPEGERFDMGHFQML